MVMSLTLILGISFSPMWRCVGPLAELVNAGAEGGWKLRAADHRDDPLGAIWCDKPARP